jgi:mannose-6-phosphate isomerase-like protein (cupin superfamily)
MAARKKRSSRQKVSLSISLRTACPPLKACRRANSSNQSPPLASARWLLLAQNRRRGRMSYKAINFRKKFALFDEQWQPKVIAEMNDYQFKVVKLQGDFIWHDHKNTDETFIVLEGDLRIDFRDGAVHLSAGELFVVPKGVEHKPYAELEVKLLLIEPRGVPNTGHEGGERTAENDVWI